MKTEGPIPPENSNFLGVGVTVGVTPENFVPETCSQSRDAGRIATRHRLEAEKSPGSCAWDVCKADFFWRLVLVVEFTPP